MSVLHLPGLVVAVAAMGGVAGCALLSKSEPIRPRYFSPERPSDRPSPPLPLPQPLSQLRLGRIESTANLEEMLIFRDSENEVGYYRLRRWTEAPEEYLRRRLARVLFEERGFSEVMGGDGPTLDAQLTAFEEVRIPQQVARVQIVVRLHDERLVRWEETVTVERPVVVATGGDQATATVAAIGLALRTAVDLIADRVVAALAVLPVARAIR